MLFLLNFNVYTFYEKGRFIIPWIFEAIQNKTRAIKVNFVTEISNIYNSDEGD